MFKYCFLFLFLLFTGSIFGAVIKPVKFSKPVVLKIDTGNLHLRNFNSAALKNYSSQPEFKYSNGYVGKSPWARFWDWIWSLITDFFSVGDRGTALSYFLTGLFILLGVAALVFLILKLAGVDALNIFSGKSATVRMAYSESLENIHEIDFDNEIEHAAGKKNYRLAVRLLYLKCLKQLSDTGKIAWDTNKTNNAYIDELANETTRANFSFLTRQFEYIWYGEFNIDAPLFNKINSLFTDFNAAAK